MNPRHKKEWYDNETFWRDLYGFMFTEQRFAETAEQVEKALELTQPQGKAALDLCCGPGRCSIELSKRGFTVTGVDKTKFLLDKAKAKARAAKVKIEWIFQDMRDFVRADSYDLVLNMFTSFGYFDNKNEDIVVLKNIFTSLHSGGVLLIEMMGKEILAKIFLPISSETLPDGTRLIECHEIFDDWSRIRNEWILIRRGRTKSFKFHHTMYSGQEIRDRLERVGFVNVRIYGSFDGTPYDNTARRLIAIAQKPSSPKSNKDARK